MYKRHGCIKQARIKEEINVITCERIADETLRLQMIAFGDQKIVERRQSWILQRNSGDPLQGLDNFGLLHLPKVFHAQSYYLLLPILQYKYTPLVSCQEAL